MKRIILSILLGWLTVSGAIADEAAPTVVLNGNAAEISNSILTLKIGSNGRASDMRLNGYATNILGSSGIYFDYTASKNMALSPSKVEIVKQTDDYLEILYSNTTDDLQWQQGWILRRGESGIYTYVIANGTPKSSSVSVKEVRVCTRLASTFLDGYVDEVMQGPIPSNAEMAYAEKNTQIQDATYTMPDGSVYTKYNWAQFIDQDLFHGLMNGEVGVWNIPVSYEWLNGGPMRQELTVHATGKSPITIQMLQGEHLGGAAQTYNEGERQIFGPFYIYVNSGATREEMIEDARITAESRRLAWPFQWFHNELYPRDRGTVNGKIAVEGIEQPASVKVVLGQPGVELIRQGKDYMFWTETDSEGNFTIPSVRPGQYSLYAYALDGTITDELEVKNVAVTEGEVDLGNIIWKPEVYAKLHWSIGQNNRRSDTWKLSDTPRAYGLWEQVPADLVYKIGESQENEDWYFAQCHNGTWSVEFQLDEVPAGDLMLTASIASSTNKPSVAVKMNDNKVGTWSFPNNDAAIYRSATQAGRHVVKTMRIPSANLMAGTNRLQLTMSGISKNGGVMYDLLKLESGQRQTGLSESVVTPEKESYMIYSLQGRFMGEFESTENTGLPAGLYIYKSGVKSGKIILH